MNCVITIITAGFTTVIKIIAAGYASMDMHQDRYSFCLHLQTIVKWLCHLSPPPLFAPLVSIFIIAVMPRLISGNTKHLYYSSTFQSLLQLIPQALITVYVSICVKPPIMQDMLRSLSESHFWRPLVSKWSSQLDYSLNPKLRSISHSVVSDKVVRQVLPKPQVLYIMIF